MRFVRPLYRRGIGNSLFVNITNINFLFLVFFYNIVIVQEVWLVSWARRSRGRPQNVWPARIGCGLLFFLQQDTPCCLYRDVLKFAGLASDTCKPHEVLGWDSYYYYLRGRWGLMLLGSSCLGTAQIVCYTTRLSIYIGYSILLCLHNIFCFACTIPSHSMHEICVLWAQRHQDFNFKKIHQKANSSVYKAVESLQ